MECIFSTQLQIYTLSSYSLETTHLYRMLTILPQNLKGWSGRVLMESGEACQWKQQHAWLVSLCWTHWTRTWRRDWLCSLNQSFRQTSGGLAGGASTAAFVSRGDGFNCRWRNEAPHTPPGSFLVLWDQNKAEMEFSWPQKLCLGPAGPCYQWETHEHRDLSKAHLSRVSPFCGPQWNWSE